MSKRSFRVAVLALAALAAVGVAQERTKPKELPSFEKIHAAIKTHYEAGAYGKAMVAARELSAILNEKRSMAILAAMPAAPEGYEQVPQKKAEANPFAGAMAASVGSVVTQQHRGTNGTIRVTITADSPMLAMAGMMFENPALLGRMPS